MRPSSSVLTPQELAVMKVVWQSEYVTVRDVYERLRTQRKIAYTTVLTMMKILERKKYLTRKRVGGRDVYRPSRSRHDVLRAMVTDFVERVFDGAASALLVHLSNHERVQPGDRERIREVISRLEE